jgi:FdhD protein
MVDAIINLKRINLRTNQSTNQEEKIAQDIPFCIFIDMNPFITIMATPNMLKELTIGHLYSEGVIKNLEEIIELEIEPQKAFLSILLSLDLNDLKARKNVILTTACGATSTIPTSALHPIQSSFRLPIKPQLILDLISELNKRSRIHKETAGTHSALIYCREKGIVAFAEDVGRHNAVDKVIGSALLDQIDFSSCILISSGRQSGEMVLKAVRAGIPVIASLAAPLMSGINIAQAGGITLIGFVRGRRMNIYTCPEKIGNQ